jgi:hypothetical protein
MKDPIYKAQGAHGRITKKNLKETEVDGIDCIHLTQDWDKRQCGFL